MTYLLFATALALSACAAFYSIIGLTTLFSGAFWPVIIMGSVLEIAKLVSVSWLHHNWKETTAFVKSYLIFAILVLMLITSMGIFGYLSRAHIEQQVKINTGVSSDIRILNNQIKTKEDRDSAEHNLLDNFVRLLTNVGFLVDHETRSMMQRNQSLLLLLHLNHLHLLQ